MIPVNFWGLVLNKLKDNVNNVKRSFAEIITMIINVMYEIIVIQNES